MMNSERKPAEPQPDAQRKRFAKITECGAVCLAWLDCGDKEFTHGCILPADHEGGHKFPCKPLIVQAAEQRATRAGIKAVAQPYPEDIFTPLNDSELQRCVDALTNSGVRAASGRLHASWARHLAKNLLSTPAQTPSEEERT